MQKVLKMDYLNTPVLLFMRNTGVVVCLFLSVK